jgi:acyl-CoA thioesterase-2
MSAPTGFLARVRLDPAGPDRWSAAAGATERIALGLLGAQAMVAAGRTVDTRWSWVHAMHVTRLDEGDPGTDPGTAVQHRVERAHDTGLRAVRLVRSVQGDTPLAVTTVTFSAPRPGLGPSHQCAAAVGDVPPPGAVAPTEAAGPLDVRHLDRARWRQPGESSPPAALNRMWTRMIEEIPDEILLHAAALAVAADLLLVEPPGMPATGDVTGDPAGEWADLQAGRGLRAVPLDLSIRIHRGFRADDWMLHGHESVSAADYRALTTGWFVSPAGRLVASISQETALLPVAQPQPQSQSQPRAPVPAACATP